MGSDVGETVVCGGVLKGPFAPGGEGGLRDDVLDNYRWEVECTGTWSSPDRTRGGGGRVSGKEYSSLNSQEGGCVPEREEGDLYLSREGGSGP